MKTDYFADGSLTEFRKHVDAITDQLCEAVTGNFDFRVRSTTPDETLDKLAMLSNFVLEGARRNMRELETKNRELEEARSTLQKKVEERTYELSLQTQKALAANKSKDQFLANMSHEMRTPLTAIMGFSDLISAGVEPCESEEFLETIRRNAQHLLSLIDDLLDFSKIESGKVVIERGPVQINDLLRNIEASFQPMVERKAIPFQVDIASSLPGVIMTDSTRIRQIITNLLANAIKFTERGSVDVSVGCVDDNGLPQLFVRVKDTGIGIAPEAQQRLFAPFSQADMSLSRKFGGTGLGLALSRKIARSLGGDLVVESSAPGCGSVFTLWVPFERAPEQVMNEMRSPSSRASTETITRALSMPKLDGLKILLAEDSADNQVLLTRILEALGAKVALAENGEEAITLALKTKVDLVLMDIQMPLLDGYEATRRLREKGFTKPILALTAHALDSELERALEAGCNDRILKPIDTEKLISTILASAVLAHA